MERKKQIEVEEKEVARKDKELVATVRRPAEAESYKVETIAQGKRYVHSGRFRFRYRGVGEGGCRVKLALCFGTIKSVSGVGCLWEWFL